VDKDDIGLKTDLMEHLWAEIREITNMKSKMMGLPSVEVQINNVEDSEI